MIPAKVANTSVKVAVLQALGKPTDQPHDPDLLDYVSKDEARRFPVRVAIVRDPLDRLASCWRDKLGQPELLNGFGRMGLRPDMGFQEFVRHVARIPDERATGAGIHFRQQVCDLCHGRKKIIPTFVGRFERLAEDWRAIQCLVAECGGPLLPDLPHENRSWRPRPRWCELSLARALKRYRRDIRVFGYGLSSLGKNG